ncbi:MAG: ATP-binding protein [Bacteroidota bacterium]
MNPSNLISQLLQMGIKEDYDSNLKNRLYIFHQDALASILGGVIFMVLGIIFSAEENFWLVTSGVLILILSNLIIFALEKNYKHTLSLWLMYVSQLVIIVAYSLALGLDTNFHFWIIILSIVPIFLFPNKPSLSIGFFLCSFVSMTVLMYYSWIGLFQVGFVDIPEESLNNFIFFSNSLFFPYFGYKCWIVVMIHRKDLSHQQENETLIRNMFDSTQALNTELLEAKSAVEEKHDYLRTILDVHPHSIFAIDAEGKITLANRRFANHIRKEAKDIIGQEITSVLKDSDGWGKNLSDLSVDSIRNKDETIFPPEPIILNKGITQWFQTHQIPIYDDNQQLQEILFLSMDVSDQIENEAAIQSSERKYRALFESSAEGIIIVDIDGRKALDCNLRAQELFEASYDEILLGNTLVFSPEYQPNGQTSAQKLHELLKEFRTNKERINSDWQFQTTTGRLFDADVTYSPLQLNGSLVSVLLVRDVTEKKQAQQNLQEKLKELDMTNIQMRKYIDSNMQLENFAYMASHDLKEPLRTTIAFSQLLQRRYVDRLDQDGKDFLEYIIHASQNMNTLITDLLAFSRVNTKGIRPEKIRLEPFLQNLKQRLWSLIDETKGQILLEDIPPQIVADKVHMQQLFQNLITNGLKFRRSDVPPRLVIRARERKKYWQFSISDNGIGISDKYFEKIFLLFRKLHGQEDYDGTGIGLAMCKKIVEQHEGEIWVKSVEGEGTTFFFTLKKNLTRQRREHYIPVKKE